MSDIVLISEKSTRYPEKIEFFVSLWLKEDNIGNYIHRFYITSFINDKIFLQTYTDLAHLCDAFEYHLLELHNKTDITVFKRLTKLLIAYDNGENREFKSKNDKTKGYFYHNVIVNKAFQNEFVKKMLNCNFQRLTNYVHSIILPIKENPWKKKFYLKDYLVFLNKDT